MATPERCEHVNGGKYFFYKVPGGEWKGSFQKQAIYSRTFMPENTEVKEAEDKATLINIIRTDKVPLKEVNLSEETKKELDKAKIVYEKIGDITPIEPLPRGGLSRS